jgi:hypothetical protein
MTRRIGPLHGPGRVNNKHHFERPAPTAGSRRRPGVLYAGFVPCGISFRRTTSQARPNFSISQIM